MTRCAQTFAALKDILRGVSQMGWGKVSGSRRASLCRLVKNILAAEKGNPLERAGRRAS
jgi:hypothetical protein